MGEMTDAHVGVTVARSLPAPDDRDVHLWRLNLGGEPPPATDAVLDANERDRAARFVFPRDRNRFLRAHHALKMLLGAYIGVPPAAVRVVREQHGKPVLACRSFGFNLSHSGDYGLIAVSRVANVGVDLEVLQLPKDARRLAASVFSAPELESLARVSDEALDRAFFACWTRKEAYLKALGVGLTLDPATVTVGVERDSLRIETPERNAHQFVDVVSIADDGKCAAALAVVGGYSKMSIFDYADPHYADNTKANDTDYFVAPQ